MSPAATRTLHRLLAGANFAVGLGAFVIIGLLSAVAGEFGLSKAEAGWLMTLYSLTYAVSSPLLVAGTGKLERVHVLTLGLLLLAAGLVLAACAPSYPLLLAARVCMALGGGMV